MSSIVLDRPYGLSHQQPLGPEHTRPAILDQAVYDVDLQLTVIGEIPMADHPQMADSTVTWGTTGNDNKSDPDK
ncbi:hypothetical protein ABGB12_30465 [Actinocorallia sp. B10E7]|uniref:hypothetical protein n=1 Tax=Actinocorallia sp. B10E7 TaxID=3153558 RepID=UPI00325F678F